MNLTGTPTQADIDQAETLYMAAINTANPNTTSVPTGTFTASAKR